MSTPKILTAIATVLGALALFAQDSTFAQDAGPYGPPGHRPFLRRDLSYHAWYYDGRDDDRDFPTNGFFPGDFAADPAHAAIGAAGLFGSTPDYARVLSSRLHATASFLRRGDRLFRGI